ncbi:hypothetical protein MC885_016679, partial [Smutsia gigantea]
SDPLSFPGTDCLSPGAQLSRRCSATPGPKKPTRRRDVPSTLVSRSPERSTQQRRTDAYFSPVDSRATNHHRQPAVGPASAPGPPGPPPSPGHLPRYPAVPPHAPVGAASGVGRSKGTPGRSRPDSLPPTPKQSPPGEGGKKIQRRSESIGKKKVQKGVHSSEKAQTLPAFKRQQDFQESAGRPLPTGT